VNGNAARDAWRRLMMPSADFYAVVDMATAKRIGGILWAAGAAITLAMLPLAVPDRPLGWVVFGVVVLGCVALALRLLRAPDRVSINELWASSFLAPAAIAGLVWAGGPTSPYAELFLLSCFYTGAVHPPRRVFVYLIWFSAAVCAPLVYDGWSSDLASHIFGHLIIWLPITLVAMAYTARVRSQRLGLTAEGDRARAQARLDALTGLQNRRAFDEEAEAAVEAAHATGRSLSVVVADLDGFKRVNDTYGHLAGDECLRAVGEAIGGAVRGGDRCYRWGGDEFAVLLPGSDQANAEAVSRRLIEAVERACTAPDGEPMRLECGTAALVAGMDVDALMTKADVALLDRKAASEA
jgi:diguanylate cyclase (GGDEF)-like protein